MRDELDRINRILDSVTFTTDPEDRSKAFMDTDESRWLGMAVTKLLQLANTWVPYERRPMGQYEGRICMDCDQGMILRDSEGYVLGWKCRIKDCQDHTAAACREFFEAPGGANRESNPPFRQFGGGAIVQFKDWRSFGEWDFIGREMQHIAREASSLIHQETGEWGMVTGILRTEKERIEIYGPRKAPGVHDFHRGVDMRAHGLSEDQGSRVCEYINQIYPYDERRPEMKTARIHKTEQGARHLHLQTMEAE